VAHYRTEPGRRKKKRLNGIRYARRLASSGAASSPLDASVDHGPTLVETTATGVADHFTVHLDGFVLDETTLVNAPVLPYLLLIVHLLEGRQLTRDELLATLRQSLRQRSIGRWPRREYVLDYLNQHPP
jgi:hypothetical protein